MLRAIMTVALFSPTTGQTLGLQTAQSRSYLYTLGPKVGTIYVLEALGIAHTFVKALTRCRPVDPPRSSDPARRQ